MTTTTTIYIKSNEISLINKLLKQFGYESTIADLKLFDKYLINIFDRIGVESVDRADIIAAIKASRGE